MAIVILANGHGDWKGQEVENGDSGGGAVLVFGRSDACVEMNYHILSNCEQQAMIRFSRPSYPIFFQGSTNTMWLPPLFPNIR